MPVDELSSTLNPYVMVRRNEGQLPRGTHFAAEESRRAVEWDSHRVKISSTSPVMRRAAIWEGMAAEVVKTTGHNNAEYRLKGDVHLLAISDHGERSSADTSVEGLPRSRIYDLRGRITVVPAGRAYHEKHEARGLTSTLFVYLDPKKLPISTGIMPRLHMQDSLFSALALRLRTLIETSQSGDNQYIEALGHVMVCELARLSMTPSPPLAALQGGLASWQKILVVEHIEKHLAEPISLRQLAQLARLSPFHFSRAFKQSFGAPPHRYHLMRRIELSKTLLAAQSMSVTKIGLTVGYSEASAFTATFRRLTGLTPTEYSRSVARPPD
jgi:AraC family transcriptional regulator